MADNETESLCTNKATYDSASTTAMASDSESTAAPSSENPQPGHKPPQEIPYAIAPYDEALGDVHDKAMTAIGFGKFQWRLFIILGLGLMGDSIELLMIAYILPGAEKDFCMNAPMKGWLGKS